MKRVAILGSTGSIGQNTLRVIANHAGRFEVAALAARRNIELLCRQIEQFHPRIVSVGDSSSAREIRGRYPGVKVGVGAEGLCEVAAGSDAGIVVVAVVGAAGLLPTICAIEAGKDIAIANKETLVMAGPLVIERARACGCRLLPVDSEHSALFQCLQGRSIDQVEALILTASGGPFREKPTEAFPGITRAMALDHPTWRMGPKITIDSATLMNKGLEVIEAHFLFDMPPEKIKIVVHPQSIIHSMVELVDGSIIAQLGIPDMRIPIQYALSYPERLECDSPKMNFAQSPALMFSPPDFSKFPCLRLAFQTLEKGGTWPAILNAANEIAVAAFLEERIGFLRISETIEATLQAINPRPFSTLDEVLAADAEARRVASDYIDASSRRRG